MAALLTGGARWRWFLAVSAAIVLIVNTGTARACRCREPAAKVAYRSADSIVLGKIVKAEKTEGGVDEVAYLVEVSEWWKESVDSPVSVYSSTTCRFDAEVGAKYVLFLKRSSKGKYETGICMGNRPVEKASRLLKFLRSKKPRRKD